MAGSRALTNPTVRWHASERHGVRLACADFGGDADGARQETAEFHSVVAYGKLGEICASHCLKGRRVYIEGRLRTREYDGSDGLRRHSTEIVAETLKLLDRPPASGDGSPGGDGDEVEDNEATLDTAETGHHEESTQAPRRRERAAAASAS
jgi:single-strand DNA-binding protein